MTEETKFEKVTINANVADSTKKILEDVFKIYKENYSDISDEDLWWYMIEDMLEAYLEWPDEEDENEEEYDDEEDED